MDISAMESEATNFALELLMPSEFLIEDSKGVDLADDSALGKLAKKYRVPIGVMAHQIGRLRATLSTPQQREGHPR